jgi:hypothetical protein
VRAFEKAGSDRRGSGNGLEAMKQPRVGANQPGRWSQKAERVVETLVVDLKVQAGNVDPGREAPRGAADPGERKAVKKIRLQAGDSLRRAGRR